MGSQTVYFPPNNSVVPTYQVRGMTVSNIADLTAVTVAAAAFDGLTIAQDERVYLAAQSTGAENGPYICGVVSGGVAVFTRAKEWDTGTIIETGSLIAVDAGTVNANTLWMITNAGDVTVGTTTPTISQASAGALGLTLSGGVLTSANRILAPAGTQLAPGLNVGSATGWGFHTSAATELAIAYNNNAIAKFGAINFQCNGQIAGDAGTVSIPTFRDLQNPDNGLLCEGAGVISGVASGARAWRTGTVGLELGSVGGLATTATAGFPLVPSMAGRPSGSFTVPSNMASLSWDRTNKRLDICDTAGTFQSLPTRLLFQTNTSTGNVDAGVDDLHSYTIAAATLAADGQSLECEFAFTFAANANSKQVKLVFGTTEIYASSAQVQNGGVLVLKFRIIRTGAATQRIVIDASSFAAVTLFVNRPWYATAAETLANALALKATGEAVATDDIVNVVSLVRWCPAA